MTIATNKQIVRQFFAQVMSQGRFDVLKDLAAPVFVDHSLPPGMTPVQGIAAFRTAFPDVVFTIEALVAEGDRVTTRWTARGTNTGDFYGRPATGKAITLSGITIQRIEDGRIVEAWVQYDQLGLMQQLLRK